MIWLITEIAGLLGVALLAGALIGWLLWRWGRTPVPTGELQSLRESVTTLTDDNAGLLATTESLGAERAELIDQVQQLDIQMGDTRRETADQLEHWGAEARERTDQLQTLEEQLKVCRDELNTTRRALADRTDQLTVARRELAESASRDEELAAVTDELNQLHRAQADTPALADAIADLERRSALHENLLERLSADSSGDSEAAAITGLQERISSLEDAVSNRSNEIVRLSAELQQLKTPSADSWPTAGDDLTQIDGIDDDMATALSSQGIVRYKHLARLGPRDLDDIVATLGITTPFDSERAIRQATSLHREHRNRRDSA